jgi:hypothetical protein
MTPQHADTQTTCVAENLGTGAPLHNHTSHMFTLTETSVNSKRTGSALLCRYLVLKAELAASELCMPMLLELQKK